MQLTQLTNPQHSQLKAKLTANRQRLRRAAHRRIGQKHQRGKPSRLDRTKILLALVSSTVTSMSTNHTKTTNQQPEQQFSNHCKILVTRVVLQFSRGPYCTINPHQHAANRRCLSSIIHQNPRPVPLPSCTAHATPSCPEVSRFAAISTVRTVCTLLNKPVFSVVVICKSTEHTSNLWIQPLGSTSRNSSDMAPQIRVRSESFGHGKLRNSTAGLRRGPGRKKGQ